MKPDQRVKAIAARIEKHLWLLNGWKLDDAVVAAAINNAAEDILAYLARRDRTLLKKARRPR